MFIVAEITIAFAIAETSLAPPQFHHLRLHITYASLHRLRLNQVITCASHDLIPNTARGIFLFAYTSVRRTYMFIASSNAKHVSCAPRHQKNITFETSRYVFFCRVGRGESLGVNGWTMVMLKGRGRRISI
jgi:hypothetical protein